MLRKLFICFLLVLVLLMVGNWDKAKAQTEVKIGTIFPLQGH